jgi:hypothetical protein
MTEKQRNPLWSLTTPGAVKAYIKDLNRVNRKHGLLGTTSLTCDIFQEWSVAEFKHQEIGAHTLEALRRAAAASHPVRKAKGQERDNGLAETFLRRRDAARANGSEISDSELKAQIGASVEGLGRTAAIDAIDRGLKLLGQK